MMYGKRDVKQAELFIPMDTTVSLHPKPRPEGAILGKYWLFI